MPSLSSYQASYRGYTFGYNTQLELLKIEGLDLPAVRSGDAGRPRDHGLFTGLDVLAGNEITFTGQLKADNISFQHAWEALATATLPSEITLEPLFLAMPGYGTLATMARVRKRDIPIDIKFALGNLADVTLLFAAPDPRWYGTPTQSVSVKPPASTAGFSFNLKFALSFGGGSYAGSLSINNTGNFETRPLLVIKGPCTNPSIANLTAPGSPTLTFNLTMNAGDKLIVDTDLHTATYYASGSTVGSTRLYALAAGSGWWVLEPGTSTIQFLTAGAGEGELEVQWAPAWIL